MKKPKAKKKVKKQSKPRPRRIRVPGLAPDKEIGLGDVLKQATAAVGLKPCAGCEQRAAVLNRWFVLSGR